MMLLTDYEKLRYPYLEFRGIYLGKDKYGRKIVRNREYMRTAGCGELDKEDWYKAAEEAVMNTGDTSLLEAIKEYILKNHAWIKTEKQAKEEALEAVIHGYYTHWKDFVPQRKETKCF